MAAMPSMNMPEMRSNVPLTARRRRAVSRHRQRDHGRRLGRERDGHARRPAPWQQDRSRSSPNDRTRHRLVRAQPLPRLHRRRWSLTSWGVWAMTATPLDAVPDISDVQVIVSTEWVGPQPRSHRRPGHLSDRHGAALGAAREHACAASPTSASRTSTSSSRTAPTSTGRAAASSSTCRAFADSCRTASTRRSAPTRPASAGCSSTRSWTTTRPARPRRPARLPGLVSPVLAGVGAGRRRGREHRRLRQAVPGQSRSDPAGRLRHVGVKDVVDAIRASNNDVEGRLLEFSGREYMVRGRGYLAVDRRHREGVARRGRARHAGPRRATSPTCGSGRTSAAASRSSTAAAKSSAASS